MLGVLPIKVHSFAGIFATAARLLNCSTSQQLDNLVRESALRWAGLDLDIARD